MADLLGYRVVLLRHADSPSSALFSACFFLPPRRLPKKAPTPPLPAASPAPGSVLRCTEMSKLLMSVTPTLRTRKAVLRFAARNAAPNAIASSPLMCWPSSNLDSLKYSSSVFFTFGMRTLPPMSSTEWISARVRLATASARSIGPVRRANRSWQASSNSARVILVMRSTSACNCSALMGYSLLADNTSFTLLASSLRRVIGLLSSLRSLPFPLAFLFHTALNR
mmetsp:Transcript_1707/g.2377  ORF Transcript_1707/g.2377 Transcript_1707/m.2377 type:complete len:224 (-) Transcript_1707:873-1544(-)